MGRDPINILEDQLSAAQLHIGDLTSQVQALIAIDTDSNY